MLLERGGKIRSLSKSKVLVLPSHGMENATAGVNGVHYANSACDTMQALAWMEPMTSERSLLSAMRMVLPHVAEDNGDAHW
jgi:hypothetical protein